MWKMKSQSTEVLCRLVSRLEIESTSIHETLITGLLFTELRLLLAPKSIEEVVAGTEAITLLLLVWACLPSRLLR